MSGAVPPPAARPLERAARVPRPVCPGCGRCGRVDPAPAPQRAPLRAGVACCGGGGRASRGGVPSTVVRGAWRQALSLPRPPVLWSGQPGFRNPCVPGAVDAGVWTQHRPHSVRPCGPALLAVGVAGGRPRGGVPSTVVRGAWCQALSLPRPPVLWSGPPGLRDPCVPGAVDAGVWTLHRPHSVRPCGLALLAVGVAGGRPRGGVPSTVVRGAWCQALSLPRPHVLWSGQPGFRCACVFVCVLCLAGSGGPASRARSGAPHLFLWPLCLSALLGPLRAGVAPPSPAALAVPRCLGAVPWFFFSASRCLALRALVPRLCLLLGRCLLFGGFSPHLLPFCVSLFSSPLLGALVFFFFSPFSSPVRPRCLRLSLVSGPWVPWASALCVFCSVGLPPLGSPCACPSFVLSAWLVVAPRRLLPPPPPLFCLAVFVAAARCFVPCAVLCCASLGAVLRRAAARCVLRCCAVLCCVVLVGCRCLLRRALWRCPLPWGPVLCGAAFCGVPPCCVCFVVAWWCVLLFAALLCAVCVPGCCAVHSLSSPLCAVLCFAVLVRSRCAVRVVRAVAGAWCCGVPWCGAGPAGPWLSAGGVFRCRCPCLAAWSVSLRLVLFAVVPCFRVSCSVVLCCRVVLCCCALLSCCGAVGACFALLWAVVLCCVVLLVGCAVFCPVVVAACCGALLLVLCVPCLLRSVRCGALLCWLWCPASLCRVLWRCAVVWCCAVVLCCRFAVLFLFALPSCGPSCGASVVCAVVGASCCGVSLCVVVSPWAFCGVVVLLWCVVVSCCAVRCPVVSCALCRVLRCRAVLLGLFLAWYLLEKPLQNFVKKYYFFLPLFFFFFLAFENKIKLYTTQHTRVQQDHVRCHALRATRRS